MDVVDLAERCCFVLHSFVFFFFFFYFDFLAGPALYVSGKVLARVLRYTHHLFTHTHTRAAELLYIVDYVMDFFFPSFPRSVLLFLFLFFEIFARLNFFNSPIDRYHTTHTHTPCVRYDHLGSVLI